MRPRRVRVLPRVYLGPVLSAAARRMVQASLMLFAVALAAVPLWVLCVLPRYAFNGSIMR